MKFYQIHLDADIITNKTNFVIIITKKENLDG